MEKIKSTSSVEISVTIRLTEDESRALEAISGYGAREFLDVFYKHLGKHYLGPYENGVISLFETIKKELPPHLKRVDEARKIWNANIKK